jgi:hypothetical protein
MTPILLTQRQIIQTRLLQRSQRLPSPTLTDAH